MLEMASLGSQGAADPIGRIRRQVQGPRCACCPPSRGGYDEGTLITYEEAETWNSPISGIAFNRDEAKITIDRRAGPARHRPSHPRADRRADIEVDMIVLNAPKDGRVDFSFTVHRNNYERACRLAAAAVDGLDGVAVTGNSQVVKISVVGVGMRTHAGIATRMFGALAAEGINVRMVATSEIKISVLVDERYLEFGVRTLHEAFDLGAPKPA